MSAPSPSRHPLAPDPNGRLYEANYLVRAVQVLIRVFRENNQTNLAILEEISEMRKEQRKARTL